MYQDHIYIGTVDIDGTTGIMYQNHIYIAQEVKWNGRHRWNFW